MRLYERAGQPKSTGWPTMWPKTTAHRAAKTPKRGVRGQGDTEDVHKGNKVCQGHRVRATWIQRRESGRKSQSMQIQPCVLYLQRNPTPRNSQVSLHPFFLFLSSPCTFSREPPENPDSWSCDISEESRWVKSLQVLHRHNSRWSTQPKGRGLKCPHSVHTKDERP